MLDCIEKLRLISVRLNQGDPLSDTDVAWLHQRFNRFLRHECTSMDEAFGLKFPRGGVPWWMEEAIRERDNALRELGRRFCPDGSKSKRARAIMTLAIRYEASTWRRDCQTAELPPDCRGTPKEWLWRAYRSGAAMPVSERHLRTILG